MMNKFGLVLGATVVATLAGCKDPDYVSKFSQTSQNEVKNVETVPAPEKQAPAPAPEAKPIETVPAEPVAIAPAPAPAPAPVVKPAESAYTMYTVRRGDYLAKISKKYNVTINSIKRLNPQLKGDTVCIGQKIKLPGIIDVEAAPVEPVAPKASTAKGSKKGASDYTGATVEYVVKNGDTLGGVAYGHGINIRQLKKLNGLTGDALKIGQKLKVPAAPAAKKAPVAAPAPAPTAPAADVAPAPAANAAPAPAADAAAPAADAAPAPAADAAAAPAPVADAAAPAAAAAPAPAYKTYIVQEGEDMAGVAVAWGITASQIRELNNMGENDQLKPGQTIRLPADAEQQ